MLDEGHVGVSVFMVLSGYLFAKLIGDQQIDYPAFLWNRAIRLVPLLMLALLAYAFLNGLGPYEFVRMLAGGTVLPNLPNGAWSITVEAHFYLILPLALRALRRDVRWALAFLFVSLSLRSVLHVAAADTQLLAYSTIVGRIDQFVLGIAAFRLGDRNTGRMALSGLVALWAWYAWFDSIGGYNEAGPDWLWVIIPMIEGLSLCVMVAWYDRHPLPNYLLLRKAGEYSYSIYLLHFFFVHQAATFVDGTIMRLGSVYLALPWAIVFFLGMMAVGHVSWMLIEKPPLRWRKKYVPEKSVEPAAQPALS